MSEEKMNGRREMRNTDTVPKEVPEGIYKVRKDFEEMVKGI